LLNVFDAATTETFALLKGLEYLEIIGCNRVSIESDSLELILGVKSIYKYNRFGGMFLEG
jgi:ribonuclease HI